MLGMRRASQVAAEQAKADGVDSRKADWRRPRHFFGTPLEKNVMSLDRVPFRASNLRDSFHNTPCWPPCHRVLTVLAFYVAPAILIWSVSAPMTWSRTAPWLLGRRITDLGNSFKGARLHFNALAKSVLSDEPRATRWKKAT